MTGSTALTSRQTAAHRPVGYARLTMTQQDGRTVVSPAIPLQRMVLQLQDYRMASTLTGAFPHSAVDTPAHRDRLVDVGAALDARSIMVDVYWGILSENGRAALDPRDGLRLQGLEDELWLYRGIVRTLTAGAGELDFSAHDFTGELLQADVPDRVWDVLQGMTGHPEDLIRIVLSTHPGLHSMPVELLGLTSTPDLATVADDVARSERRGAIKYWDLIWNIAALAGLVVFVDRRTVYLTTPRTYYFVRQDEAERVRPTGFLLREDRSSSVKLTKDWKYEHPRVVEVRSYRPEHGDVIKARFPEPEVAKAMGLPQEADVLVKVIRGVTDVAVLMRYARQLWDAQTARRIRGTFSTSHPDALSLRVGYPVLAQPRWLDKPRRMRLGQMTVSWETRRGLDVTGQLQDWLTIVG